MNDDNLQQLLKQADDRFQAATLSGATSRMAGTAFVESVRHQRARQVRRRTALGVVAVVLFVSGLSSWSWNAGKWSDTDADTVASNSVNERTDYTKATSSERPTERQRLSDDEIARLKAEIAALDVEVNHARRFIELYQAAEARRERLAAVEAHAEPLLSPRALADLEIDRAAAISVISADAQANEFNRPADAADAYRSVVKHFPDSRWASVARERLAQTMN
jgi:TolA-binding protein